MKTSIHVDNIDIELLEKQKQSLYQTIVNIVNLNSEEVIEDLQGILNLLDYMCDIANPVSPLCNTCKRTEDQYTIGCPECFEDEHAEEEQIMRCPGCGCLPGDGLIKDCNHPDGCGYFRGDNDPS